MDELLGKHKKLFITIFIILAVLAAWHLYYVIIAMQATGHKFLLQEYGMLTLGLVMLALCVGIVLLCTSYKTELVWIIALFLLGISSMRVMPGLSAPDEPAHYISAYYLSNQLMMMEPDNEEGRVHIRKQDLALEDMNGEIESYLNGEIENTEIFGQEPKEENYYEVHNWKKNHEAESGTTTSLRIRVETTPLVYLPQASGISLARTFNASPLTLLTMGKLFNLIAFCIMTFWAAMRMPLKRGKDVMMASALLPMTINLAASFSYDAMLIALSYMFISEVMYLAYEKDSVEWKDIIILAVILAIMSPCKMVYCVITALILIIPKEKYTSNGMHVAMWAICIVAALGSIALVNATIIGKYASATSNELVYAGGEEGYTAAYVVRHPLETIRLVYDTFIYQGGYYHQTLIGAYLGNASESLDVPYIVIMLLTLGLLLLPLKNPEDEEDISSKDKWIIAIISIVIFGLLLGSMLIGWTQMNSPVIQGVQGRYFLPLLPMILLLVRNNTVVLKTDVSKYVLFGIVACDAFALYRMYSMICLHI